MKMKRIELTKALTNKDCIYDFSKAPGGAKLMSSHIIIGVICVFQFVLAPIMATLSIASVIAAVCMIGGFNPYMLFPQMPYWCGSVLALALIALSVSAAVGCMYFASPLFPRFSEKTCKKLREFALCSLAVFAICFISGYFVCAVSAGTLGFWHEWNWFIR